VALLSVDEAFLADRLGEFEAFDEGGFTCVVLKKDVLPDAYAPRIVDLLVRLPTGYPNANPDMFWTTPGVRLANGTEPAGAGALETYGQRTWQRWSRHYPSGGWRPGVDSLRTYIATIRGELRRGV
jgi:Prokaryotic E2 family E